LSQEQHSFRFADPQLQARLIAAIRNAGLSYEVTDDGTVMYPQDASIGEFYGPIIESIVSDGYGWYRVTTLDEATAERYRRFKKFRGTPMIEEIWDGKSEFLQSKPEKLFRSCGVPTNVSFVMSDESLDPSEITAALGISPTFACRKGEPFARPFTHRKKDVPPRPSQRGCWELCSVPHVQSNEIEPHLEWLLGLLEPVVSVIADLSKRSNSKEFRVLQVRAVRPLGSSGASFSGAMLGRLSEIIDRMDVWPWRDDCSPLVSAKR
jgi:hypothetical protein